MIRLIYVSKALSPLPLDLKDILRVSRHNNERLEMTGALCFIEGVYFQYLEGETVQLQDLYKRITHDDRHQEPRLLERSRITERLFQNWSMALVTWNAQTQRLFETVNGPGPHDLYTLQPEKALATFESMARSSNWQQVDQSGESGHDRHEA